MPPIKNILSGCMYFCFLYLIIMVYLHSAFSSQTKLLTKSPQCTVTSVFSPILQCPIVVQRQEALDMLGDSRVPEGP